MIRHDVRVFIAEIGPGWVKLGVEADPEIPVHLDEVYEAIQRTRYNGPGINDA